MKNALKILKKYYSKMLIELIRLDWIIENLDDNSDSDLKDSLCECLECILCEIANNCTNNENENELIMGFIADLLNDHANIVYIRKHLTNDYSKSLDKIYGIIDLRLFNL